VHRVVRTLPEVEGSSVKKVKEITLYVLHQETSGVIWSDNGRRDSAPNSHMLLTKVLPPPNPLF
jgi:hypothetical protein